MKRKGFTLIELLIIIAVIGILAATMTMGGSDAMASAKASNIISNMRNMKTAALSLYYDKLDTWNGTTTTPTIDEVKAYIDSANSITGADNEGGEYNLAFSGEDTAKCASRTWFITYTFPTDAADADKIKTRIAGHAKSVGLSGSDGKNTAPTADTTTTTVPDPIEGDADHTKEETVTLTTYKAYSNEATVCLKVR